MAREANERRKLRGVLNDAAEEHAKRRRALLDELENAHALPAVGKGDDVCGRAAKALAEAEEAERQIDELTCAVAYEGIEVVRSEIERLGLSEQLAAVDNGSGRASFTPQHPDEWGRPEGFDGLVVLSPRGVPVLVARRRLKDDVLRRVGEGTDLWFQSRDCKGSRVLLRTSMRPDLARSSRECMEFAADLAAFFSDHFARRYEEELPIMFTDSRHVAPRGASRVGNMKPSKKLGLITGRPPRVETDVLHALNKQAAWLPTDFCRREDWQPRWLP